MKDPAVSNFLKGSLRIVILNRAAAGPVHGYALIKEIREKTGCYYGPSTIYPLLGELKKQGYLKSGWTLNGDRPNKVYTITNEGAREIHTANMQIRSAIKAVVPQILADVAVEN